jgi:tetratricopeptide (TPR) repeat protein
LESTVSRHRFSRPVFRNSVCVMLFVFCSIQALARPAFGQMTQMNTSSPVMEMKDEIPPDRLPPPQKMTGIGNVSMQIAATSEAQAWFNQGLNLLHDFWDYESARAFEQAVRVDPRCAMCYWGLYRAESYYHSTSPDYAAMSLAKAVSLEKHASKRERMYIDADAAAVAAMKNGRNQAELLKSVDILRNLVKDYPKDTQAPIFLALGVGFGSPEGLSALERVMKQDPNNSAANHYYIHGLEAQDPKRALHSAEILASLAPASGHMVHMPGHIYYRLGDYAKAEQAFDDSMRVDEAYMKAQHVAVDDDWNYVHNLMYAVANLLEEGKLKQATEYSAKLTRARGELDSTLYPFSARDSIARLNPELPVALRIGDWAQVIALAQAKEPPASQPNLRFLARELATFGAGMQAADARDADKAQEQSAQFDAELWRMTQQIDEKQRAGRGGPPAPPSAEAKSSGPPKIPVMSDAYIQPLLSMLSVMSLELRGSAFEAAKRSADAKAAFNRGAQEEKALGYHEPPLYIRPVGETEAAALFAAGDFAGAKAAYQQALTERPRSGFPLYGIALCSEKMGDLQAAAKEYSDFLAAWNAADPDLPQLAHARTYVAEHAASAGAGHPVPAEP